MSEWRVIEGDCLERLRELEAGSVQTCVTSPPYFGLRDYGHKGQIGLEPTPDLYVQALVGVFREVRRVLRDDGTLWLNLGDSYANFNHAPGSTQDNSRVRGNSRERMGDIKPHSGDIPVGLKPKDLLGIPWRVAQALQEPYYTGTIKDERDRIWLAAMIDAEGCMFIHKRKVGQSNGQGYVRKNDSYGAGLEISSTDRCIVEKVLAITGRGSICKQTPEQNERRKQTIYRWNLRSNECRDVIREVYPYLTAKQHEARLVLGCPSSGLDALRAHRSLKAIHQGGMPDIDFAAPEPMFERGWFLRSDIIWAKLLKPNPMPESVTDRPTKAHEYLFLLSKGPRYFYDADAIREGSDHPHLAGKLQKVAYHDESAMRQDGDRVVERTADRNKRSVWTVATQPFPGAHFAVFPPKLIEPCVLAGTSERCCGVCGAPWRRVVERVAHEPDGYPPSSDMEAHDTATDVPGARQRLKMRGGHFTGGSASTTGWEPSCEHVGYTVSGAAEHENKLAALTRARAEGMEAIPHPTGLGAWRVVPSTGSCVVLDPFCGAGTTGVVATRNGRSFIGIELNPEYAEMARQRIRDDAPLMNYLSEAA